MSVFYSSTRKTWYIRVTIDKKRFYCYRPDTRSDTFKNKKAATAYEPLFIASILGEKHKDKLYINDDYLEGYYQFMRTRLKPSTFYGYKNTFEKYWKRFFYGLDVSTITNTTLETFNAKVFKSPETHNGTSASGKLFVRYLKRTKPELDMENIAAPKRSDPKTHEYNIYSEEEFARFLSVIKDKRDCLLFLILFHYGLRISECLALRWSDFKMDGLHIERTACVKNDTGGIIFTSPKTSNSYRVYPIIDLLRPYIEDEELRQGEYVFPGAFGNPVLGQSHVRRRVDKYSKLAGVKRIKLHEFRHSCVSNLLMHGLTPRLVARWVGDTESMILSTYSHLLPSEKLTIADYINQNMTPITQGNDNMAKKQAIALGRKTFKEYVRIIMDGPESIETIHKATVYKDGIKDTKCLTQNEKQWFDIGFLHKTEQGARDFENWNKGFWDGVESTKYDDIDIFQEPPRHEA